MTGQNSEFWVKAQDARDKLVDQFLDHPAVSMIDIGYALDPKGKDEDAMKRIVLRVHVRQGVTRETLDLPTKVDDIPVEVMVADYRLE